LAVAEEICTLITIIHKGKIIASDTPANIKGSIASAGGNLEEAFLSLTAQDELESLRSSLGIGGQPVDPDI
jgi:ABC-type multidrug transport system ATPase subunit